MAEAPSTFMLLLRLGVSLGLVLALVGGITWVLRRRGLLRPAHRGTDGRLEILDRKALGKRASLVVARVGGTAVLVGVTDTHISVLSEAPGLDAAWTDRTEDAEPLLDTADAVDVPDLAEQIERIPLDLAALDTAARSAALDTAARSAARTTEARRTGLHGDSQDELATTTRMSFVETLRELTVRRT